MNLNNLEKSNQKTIDINHCLQSSFNLVDLQLLNQEESDEIRRLIDLSNCNSIEHDDLCKILDFVWDEIGCDNQNINWENIQKFYNHSVWLLNGFFAEKDEQSMQHRNSISDWIIVHKNEIKSVLDYGGGFGTLARLILQKDNNLMVDIYEPHPHRIAILKSEAYKNLHFIDSLNRKYDCLVCTDVLEHVVDPLSLLAQMIESVNINGYLIIANHFAPTIKCHLPVTFHFLHTFDRFAQLMGLSVLGSCRGSHATVYKKTIEKSLNWEIIRGFEKISKRLYPFLKLASRLKRVITSRSL
jgi:2-polyprenyl-6-hydroxyphenyl methylase/3-demethylubiquinone-9 3-methyltransferase